MTMENEGMILHGVGIGSGSVCGVLRPLRREREYEPVVPQMYLGYEAELGRLRAAMAEVTRRLLALSKRASEEIGEAEAQIFEIHAMLLEDPDFWDAANEELLCGRSAEAAVERASEKYAAVLSSLADPYLKARAADLRDVGGQIRDALAGRMERTEEEKRPYILVAQDLSPSETMTLDKRLILGIVTFAGTPNSHTAILARAMRIPALIGIGQTDAPLDGQLAILDAKKGSLVVSPTREQLDAFERDAHETSELEREHDRYLRSLINKPAFTRGGHRMLIYANVADADEAASAHLNGADGIGLLRSEMLYLSLDRYPTEEELYQSYRSVVERMQGKRIVIRTLDIGADKQIAYFGLKHEENPAMGFRGVRVCLARKELFKTQLRAILRASAHGTLSVMIPMIVSVAEIRACKQILEECKADLTRAEVAFDREVEFGIMVETPAAAVMCEELAAEVDFFSVGTNDLLQYTLAADRQNPSVASICDENTEPVMRLIEGAARAIHATGGWIGICGELAADLRYTQRFADMEIDELSVSVPYLLGLRERVIECK